MTRRPRSSRPTSGGQTQAERDWLTVIQRVLAGIASRADLAELQSGVIDGRILLSGGNQSVDVGRDVKQSVVLAGPNNSLHVHLGDDCIEALRTQLFPTYRGVPPPFPSLVFLGRHRHIEEVKRILTKVAPPPLLIVRGWPGVGKTSIVSVIGRDDRLLKHFPDGVLWTSLGQKPTLLSSMVSWGAALGTDAILRAPTLKTATEQLSILLTKRKSLLLVDDVWDPSHLTPFLAARGPECAILATTREPGVAEAFTASPLVVYTLPVLDEPYAVDLMETLAPQVVRRHRAECMEVVRALGCLPLAIHVAGRLLAAELRYGWGVRDLLEDLKTGTSILDKAPPEDRLDCETAPTVAALLQKSTDRLDAAARECYAILGVFPPKPATFDLPALKAAWNLEDPKPIARNLASRGLLEPLGQGQFQMHALLVAHARSLLERD